MTAAATGLAEPFDGTGLWIALIAVGATVFVAIGLEAARVVDRIQGPEKRLRQCLQRIRSGDLGFRVALRRGDLLGGLARECNELLEWLNKNPPAGATVGSDVVEVPVEEETP